MICKPDQDKEFIYRLMDGDKIFYIGKTADMAYRLHTHIKCNPPAGKNLVARVTAIKADGRLPRMELIQTIFRCGWPFNHFQYVIETREWEWITYYRSIGKELVNCEYANIHKCYCEYCRPLEPYRLSRCNGYF